MEKSANFSNTVIVMLTTKIPYNLLKTIKEDLEIYKKGIWKFKVKTFYLYIVEIDKLEGDNIEIEYLYLFGNREKLKEGLLKLKRLKVKEKKLIDFLYKRYYIRYINFEKEIPPEVKMPKVYEADITDLIAPFKEKWKREGLKEGLEEGKKQGLKQGLEQGKKEGIKQGLEQGIKQGLEEGKKQGLKEGLEEGKKQGELKTKIETAKKLLKKGIDIEIISEATGLSKKELKKYGII
jgi:hypothetical protein